MGYIRIAVVSNHFELPYQRYFTTTDYVSASIDRLHYFLVTALLTIVMLSLQVATQNSYSVSSASEEDAPERLTTSSIHLIGISSIVGLGLSWLVLAELSQHFFLLGHCTFLRKSWQGHYSSSKIRSRHISFCTS